MTSAKEAVRMQVTTIGPDIAKNLVQAHGIDARGRVVLRRRLVLAFFADLSPCSVASKPAAGRTTGRASCARSATMRA